MKLKTHVFILAMLAFAIASTHTSFAQDKEMKFDASKVKSAVIHTNFGDIEIEFYYEDAPKTVTNWVTHAHNGYYDGIIFHRVIKGFMMQGGDPTGSGSGGKSIYGPKFEDEIDPNSELYKTGYKRGVMAMANAGPNTNGSQFFIMHKDYPLQPHYTIFANVINGLDVVDKICENPTARGDRPIKEVKMKNITLNFEE